MKFHFKHGNGKFVLIFWKIWIGFFHFPLKVDYSSFIRIAFHKHGIEVGNKTSGGLLYWCKYPSVRDIAWK